MGQTYNARMARGRGRYSIDRIPYVIEQALPILKDFRHIILVETSDPVAFFAYPNKPSLLKPEGCEIHRMCEAMKVPWQRCMHSLMPLAPRLRMSCRKARGACQADRCAYPRIHRAGHCDGDPRKRNCCRRIDHHRP